MAFGNVDRVLTYSRERGIFKPPNCLLPDWLRDIITESNTTTDYDASYAFCRAMTMAGAVLMENYGQSSECVDVWQLPADDAGWLIVHFDGEDCDAFFYFDQLATYMEFQVAWVVPMANKIMAWEKYLVWKNEMEKSAEVKPCLH